MSGHQGPVTEGMSNRWKLGQRVKSQRFWRPLVRDGSSFLTFAVLSRVRTEQEASGYDILFKMSEAKPVKAARLGDAGSQEASSWGYHRG
jgi:hypothetical protein